MPLQDGRVPGNSRVPGPGPRAPAFPRPLPPSPSAPYLAFSGSLPLSRLSGSLPLSVLLARLSLCQARPVGLFLESLCGPLSAARHAEPSHCSRLWVSQSAPLHPTPTRPRLAPLPHPGSPLRQGGVQAPLTASVPLLALPKGGWAEHGLLLEYGEAGSVEGVRVRAWERRHARVQTVAPEQARSGTRICVSRCPRCRVGPRQPSLRLCGSECGSDPIGECGQDRLVCKSGTPARNGLVCACGCEHAHVLTRVCVCT